jgi:hypothetical protein
MHSAPVLNNGRYAPILLQKSAIAWQRTKLRLDRTVSFAKTYSREAPVFGGFFALAALKNRANAHKNDKM